MNKKLSQKMKSNGNFEKIVTFQSSAQAREIHKTVFIKFIKFR